MGRILHGKAVRAAGRGQSPLSLPACAFQLIAACGNTTEDVFPSPQATVVVSEAGAVDDRQRTRMPGCLPLSPHRSEGSGRVYNHEVGGGSVGGIREGACRSPLPLCASLSFEIWVLVD